MPSKGHLSWPTRQIWLILVLAGCAGAPIAQTPAASIPSSPASSAATSGQPTPPRTAAPTQSGGPELYIGGTITWTAQATKQDVGLPPQIQNVSGTADIVIHVVTPYLLLAERDGGSTYSYDYANNYDCPSSHEEGTLESQVGVGTTEDWDYSIATLNPGGPVGEDLHLQIIMPDYCGASMGGEVDRSRPYFTGFPDCEPSGDQLYARFDGVENYVIDCEAVFGFGGVDNNVGSVTGHVSGTLSPVDGPH
jgi:hypothetical protein